MIQENLRPSKISDIVLRMGEYLSAMRSMENEDAVRFIDFLDNYTRDYFQNSVLDELELKKVLIELADLTYLMAVNLNEKDIHTNGYFGIVVNRLFWELQQRNILAFFVVDNNLRDDRFKMVVELVGSAGFSIIYPYSVDNLQFSDKYTLLPILDYKSVEKKIDESKSQKKHIFYIEKDTSINYLNNVLALAEEFQSKYVCVFRNKAPDGESQAIWLTGSFGDYLNLPQ